MFLEILGPLFSGCIRILIWTDIRPLDIRQIILPDTNSYFISVNFLDFLDEKKVVIAKDIYNFLYTGYPANETGYPAGYRIPKKAGYPAPPYFPYLKFGQFV